MCQASRAVTKKAIAQQDARYGIGTVKFEGSRPGRVGALHALGSTTKECVYCVQTGQQLTLLGIPKALQDKHGIGGSAVVTFHVSGVFHRDDVLDFGEGKRVQFREFADCGVQAHVGILQDKIAQKVSGMMKDATAGAGPFPEGDERMKEEIVA